MGGILLGGKGRSQGEPEKAEGPKALGNECGPISVHPGSGGDDSYSVRHQGGSGVCYADAIAKQEQNISVFQKI